MSPLLISRPPGWRLRQIADVLFSERTFAKFFGPTLDEMQHEYFDALNKGRLGKARMALARGYWSFWSDFMAQIPTSVARRIYEIWRNTKTGT